MRRLLFSALLLTRCVSLQPHPVTQLAPAPGARVWSSWQEVLAHPTQMKVAALVTARVLAPGYILIDPNDPRTPTPLKEDQWVPAPAYLVQVPGHAPLLLDTGVALSGAADCSYGERPFFWIPCRSAPDQELARWLTARGAPPSELGFVVLSHAHGDHAGGLRDVMRAAGEHRPRVLFSDSEWAAVQSNSRLVSGYLTEQLQDDYRITVASHTRALTIDGWSAIDLYGDGAVWLLFAAGHTEGELAVLLNAVPRPLLLTFDASHLQANLELQVPPYAVNREAAVASLARLKQLAERFPSLEIVFGHEPTQWPTNERELR